MKKNKVLLWVVIALAAVVIGAAILYQAIDKDQFSNQFAGQESAGEAQGDGAAEEELVLAPDFTVYDIDGNEVHLSDYLGKPVVVNFWASWCGPCRSEMADFNEVWKEMGGDVQFLMINMTDNSRETVEVASAFVEKEGYEFPVFYDTDGDASTTYGAYSLPTTYFIDAEGHGVAQARGAIPKEILLEGISMILPE